MADEIDKFLGTFEKKERFCPNCGRRIPFDAKICPYCMKKFED